MTGDPDQRPDVAAGLQRYDAGAYDEAAELFGSALKKAPDDPTVMRLLGLALTRAGRPAEGLPHLARALLLAPHAPLAHLHYGIALQAGGRFAEAAETFRKCKALLPNDPAPAVNLAAALLELGEIEPARQAASEAVALAPSSAAAQYTLGLAELAARRFEAARDALAEAVRLDPQFAKAWFNLGAARFRLGDVAGAVAATERSVALDPANSLAQANLAAFQSLRGEQQEAIDRLRAVLARDPGCVPVRINLGGQLVMDQEPEEALAVLDGTPPPGPLGAQWRTQRVSALLHLGRRAEARAELAAVEEPFGDAEILVAWRRLVFARAAGDHAQTERLAARIAELADHETGPLLEHRVIAHFELARFRNLRAERALAFAHWRKGHALLSRSQPFSRADFAAFFDASKEVYGKERLNDGPRANNRDMAPLFIVGLPRSGTTLIEQILAAHPDVHGAGERFDLHRTLNRLAGPVHDAQTMRRAANLPGATLSAAALSYLGDLHALAPQARYIADKMPGNALHLGFIATLLPRARVILCERDVRDIALSIFQFRFFGYHPYAHDPEDLGWYIGQHQALMEHWRAMLPLKLLRVRLDDWVGDFRGTLRRVLEFLDLLYDEACENFHAQRRKVRTASASQVRRPVNARGIGRWRAYATELAPLFAELDRAGVLPTEESD